jgi:hypothetical protein
MLINETLDALKIGVCSMVYTKMDGEVRHATGTLNPHLIPGEFHPKKKPVTEETPNELARRKDLETPSDLVHYFDFGSKGWRCFWLENLKSLSVHLL